MGRRTDRKGGAVSRKAKKRLTGKQQNFVNEYLIDLNATAAAKRAGYSGKSAHDIGWENLRKPEVAAEIAKRRQRMIEKLEITQEMVVQELAKLAFSNIGDYLRIDADGAPYLDFSDLTEAQTAALDTPIPTRRQAPGVGFAGEDSRLHAYPSYRVRSRRWPCAVGTHAG